MRIINNFVLFWGNDDIYSNFYPTRFSHQGITCNCSEQCFMYCKAMYFKDTETAKKIMAETAPYEQKKRGREVQGFDKATWDRESIRFMTIACYAKFRNNAALREQLLATGEMVIVEASPFDKIWGIGLAEDDPRATQPGQWRGKNLLGQVLMAVRTRIRQELLEPLPA